MKLLHIIFVTLSHNSNFLNRSASSEMREREREINIREVSLFFSFAYLSISLFEMGVPNRAIALYSLLFYPGVILHTMNFL
jgi:hypothetical protein